MRKKIIAIVMAFFHLGLYVSPPELALASHSISINAASAILMDNQTGKILYSKTPNIKLAPASTIKILSAIVIIERLSLSHVVRVPSFAYSIEPCEIDLRGGERFYVRDLLKAMLISSANDAAEVLGYAAGCGSRQNFASLMNAKARSIGCKRSHFSKASGLPAVGQYSTAYDMALIMREAHRYPFIINALKTKTCSISSLEGRKVVLKNHNKLLFHGYDEVVGKTGWTRKAKHCFVGHMECGERKLVVSLFGSCNRERLWEDLKSLYHHQKFEKRSVASRNTKEKIQVCRTKKL